MKGGDREDRNTPIVGAYLALLGRVPLFASLPPAELLVLLDSAQLVSRAPRGTMRTPGNDGVIVLLRGTAGARMLDPVGREVLAGLLGPGDLWGLAATMGARQPSVELTAFEATTALRVSGAELRWWCRRRPEVAAGCLRMLADELARAQVELSALAHTSSGDRVRRRLLELAGRHGRHHDGAVEITVPLTQRELGAWAHASRESTAKELQHLREAGLIETGRRHLRILDLEGLSASLDPELSGHQRPAPANRWAM
jgi:CRP/FNR family transcriptional regulator, cyclic AMP receptor protein